MSGIHKELSLPRAQLLSATAFEVVLTSVVILLPNAIRVLHRIWFHKSFIEIFLDDLP